MQHDDIRIGDRIGPYRVIGMLAGGGYRGMHEETSRRVHLDIAARYERFRDATMRMIETARILESLRHPGVARLADRGVLPDHRPWFAVEVPSGIGLYELIARRALPPREVAGLVHDLADVLADAHARGIVHGALALRSVVLATGSRDYPLCVTDWGFEPTDLGVYAAPEGTGTPAADVFALGVIAYRAAMQKFPAVPIKDVPPLPPELAELVVRMLAIDPADRPGAAEVRALAQVRDDRVRVPVAPIPRTPKWTPAPPITSEARAVASGEIPDRTERTEKLDDN